MLISSTEFMPERILMTADTVGGVWVYALELARALNEYDVEIALATMGRPLSREQRDEIKRIPNVGIFESSYKLEWMQDSWEDVDKAGQWLLELESRIKPDLIHLNGYAHGALCWHAPVLIVGHSCVLSWWKAVKGEDAPAYWNRYRDEVAKGLRAASIVAAPTKAMLSALIRFYGPLADGRVVPNGLDASLFMRDSKEKFILTAGRLWDEAKNVAALEQVAHSLEWPVYVAGEHVHPDGGTSQHKNVRLLGSLSRQAIASWFAHASIYALPARYESFGLSVLEAGLAECALVLGDIASLRETWEGAAVFVPPNDTEALNSALKELIADTTRRKVLAARARFRASELTPQRIVAGYLAAYSDLMARAKKKVKEDAACA